MKSSDFIRIMPLVYNKKYQIISYSYNWAADRKGDVSITLEKNGDKVEIKSSEPDVISWVSRIKKVYNSKGDPEYLPVKDVRKYYDEFNSLIDENNEKLQSAIHKISRGEIEYDFDVNNYVEKLVLGKYDKKDKNMLKLKTYYWEILADRYIELKEYQKLGKEMGEKNPEIKKYNEVIAKKMKGLFGKESNFIQFYRKMDEVFTCDIIDMTNNALEEYKYTYEILKILSNIDNISEKTKMRIILDSYRRMVEVIKQSYYTLFYLIKYMDDEYEVKIMRYVELINTFKDMDDVKQIVSDVDPYVRNSESHCTTEIQLDNEQKVEKILIIDNRNKDKKILCEYTPKKMVEMTNQVKNVVVKSMLYSIGAIILSTWFLLLQSEGYKYLILRLGNE